MRSTWTLFSGLDKYSGLHLVCYFSFVFFPHPFIRIQFIFSACHSSYWYMLRGCSLTGNLITPSSTCQFGPSLCQPTPLFIASALQLAISPRNSAGPLPAAIDFKPMPSQSLIPKCTFGLILSLNINIRVCLSIFTTSSPHEKESHTQTRAFLVPCIFLKNECILWWLVICSNRSYF